MPQARPNILMIICHDIGQHVGCLGAPIQTPNIDSIANDGVLFTNYHCTAASCSPSRGSIFTGKYPHSNGLMGLAHIGWGYNPGETTLQMRLQQAGYSTHLFGVQHETTNHPSTLGYDTYVKGNRASEAGPATCEWLLDKGASRDDRPWFASMGTFEPHRPFEQEGYPRDDPDTLTVQPWLPDTPGVRYDTAGLNGMVWTLDEYVGQVRKALSESGLADDTLLIFTTDHGTAMPRAKGTCYDPGTKTTLAMHLPGRFEGGRRHDELLTNCDLSPTVMQFIGEPAPDGIDGRSFLGLLDTTDYTPRDDIFSEMTWHDRYNPMRCVRTNSHKYIRNFGDRPLVYLPKDIWDGPAGQDMREEYYAQPRPAEQLYDLESDPLEMTDVARNPQYADVLVDLRARVDTWMRESNDKLLEGDWPPSEQQMQREQENQPN